MDGRQSLYIEAFFKALREADVRWLDNVEDTEVLNDS